MDYSKLRRRIRAYYDTQAAFAKDLGVSECTMSLRLNGLAEWTAKEIRKACELLEIPPEEIPAYFFN